MTWRSQGNLAILGGTRQGKGVLVNQLLAIDDRLGILFAPDPEPWFDGVRLDEPRQLSAAIARGADRIVIECDLWDDVADRHATWARALLQLGDRLEPFRATLAVDEAQDVDADLLTLACKRGLKRGIRSAVITQDPSHGQIPSGALSQCDHIAWVGPPSGSDISWLQGNSVIAEPADALRDAADHQVTVIDRRGEIVWRGYADVERFGPNR